MAGFEAFPACTFVSGLNPTRFSCPTIALPTNLARPSGWQTNERLSHGMGTTQHRWHSRNRIRLLHEVV